MAKIKSHTDLNQSKKLAEILPFKSADCFWNYDDLQKYHRIDWFEDGYNKDSQLKFNINNTPAWSLVALLEILPPGKVILHDKNGLGYKCIYKNIDTNFHDNPVDACVEMILKLHERKML